VFSPCWAARRWRPASARAPRPAARGLPSFRDVFGAWYGVGEVHVEDVASRKPVEQHAESGQVLLDGAWESFPGICLTKAATFSPLCPLKREFCSRCVCKASEMRGISRAEPLPS
jgi:hypothetical protein